MLLLSFPICRFIRQLKKSKKTICYIKVICLLMACGLTSQSVVAEPNKTLFITLGSQLEPSLGVTGNQPLVLNDQCSIQQRNGKVTDISDCPVGDYDYVKSSVSPEVISTAKVGLVDIEQLVIETNNKHSIEENNLKQVCTKEWKVVWEKTNFWGWFSYYYPTWKQVEECKTEVENPQLVKDLEEALKIAKAAHLNLVEIYPDGVSLESIKNLEGNYRELQKHYPISNTDLKIKPNVHQALKKLINEVYQITVKITPPVLTNISVEAETPAYTAYEIRVDELLSRAGVQYDDLDSKLGIYIDSDGKTGAGSWKYCENTYTCRVVGNDEYLSAENGAKLHYQPDLQNGDGEWASLSFYAWDQAYKTEQAVSLDWATLSLEVKQVINYITIGTADPSYIFYDGFIDMKEDQQSPLIANISKNQNNPVEFKVLEGYEDDQYKLILEVDSGQLVHTQQRGRKIILSGSLSLLQAVIDNGYINYHPDKDFNGEVLLTLTLAQQNDRQSQSQQTFSLNIEAVNDRPTFANQELKKLPKLYENEAVWSFEYPKAEDVDYDKLSYTP